MLRRIVLTFVVLALGAVGVVLGDDALRPPPRLEVSSFVVPEPQLFVAPPAVLADRSDDQRADAQALGDRLDGLIAADGLGDHVGLAVAVLGSDELLYAQSATDLFTPASTMKIVTTAAVLELLGPDARFETSVVAGSASEEIVLVAGGDPTLTVDEQPFVAGGGTLDDLARQTAAALSADGVTSVRLGYDQSLFTGAAVDEDWPSTYISSDVVAPVTALQVDRGRLEPGFAARADDPALDAAQEFASMLEEHGVTVTGPPAEVDEVAGDPIASITSAPLANIVEYVLATSDNDVAENLARHAGLAGEGEASAAAAPVAVADALRVVGVDLDGSAIRDGSGLARNNTLTPESLVRTLNAAAERPELRTVLTGLPVASFTGTLAERVADGGGSVRAKTGTLTGITALAGTVLGDDGTTYVFAALADDITSTLEARAAMDEIAEAISQCGCG